MFKCERCHDDSGNTRKLIWHSGKEQFIPLCENCYRFISQLFDDVIDEYVLRKE